MKQDAEYGNKRYWKNDLSYGGEIFDEAKKELRKLRFAYVKDQAVT